MKSLGKTLFMGVAIDIAIANQKKAEQALSYDHDSDTYFYNRITSTLYKIKDATMTVIGTAS